MEILRIELMSLGMKERRERRKKKNEEGEERDDHSHPKEQIVHNEYLGSIVILSFAETICCEGIGCQRIPMAVDLELAIVAMAAVKGELLDTKTLWI